MLRFSFIGLFKGYRHQGLEKLCQLVDGKRVAVVGNAESLFRREFGADIDKNDVVIRLNRGFIRNPKAQGSRTDVVATGQPLTLSQIDDQYGAKLVFWVFWRWWRIPSWTPKKWQSVEVIPVGVWRSINAELRLRPTSGYVMLRTLMEHTQMRELNIYGFDFYETPNFYAKPRPVPVHDTDEERVKLTAYLSTRPDCILHVS